MRLATSLLTLLALASAASAQEAFPRRLLFVQVSDYLYLSPLTHAAPGGADRTREAATRLATALRIPKAKDNDQLFVLSDTTEADSPLPTKDVIEKSLDGFCSTTRGQDRVVIYFGVHAIEKDGKVFVVPFDGDSSAAETLLPVADVYAKLKELKAAQKVVIWDVCRANPERVRGRRDSGLMTPALFKALTTVPEGVQVMVSCSPEERSLEYFTPPAGAGLPGSAYLDAIRQAAADDTAKTKLDDAIPVVAIHKIATKSVAAVAKAGNVKQTPALAAGAPVDGLAKYDPKEAPAKRFAWPAVPAGAPPADVKAVLAELALPPLLDDDTAQLARLPFPAAALKNYTADVSVDEIFKNADKYPLRVATLRSLQAVRDKWPLGGKNPKLATVLNVPINNQAKRTATKSQELLALAVVHLDLELESLLAVAEKREKETRRWQAHYDFAVAELRLRLVVLNEYNRTLAHVKTETLPDLPGNSTGWRLVPAAKLEGRNDVQKMLGSANQGLTRLTTEHKGTPWEVLAKRSLASLPSARWEPLPPKPEEK